MMEASAEVSARDKAVAAATARAKAKMARMYKVMNVFYAGVATGAIVGQTMAGAHTTGWQWWAVAPFAIIFELVAVVVSGFAHVRQLLGERAIPTRIASATMAACTTGFNLVGHGDPLVGGFFALFTASGYGMFLAMSAAQRRDELRDTGLVAHQPPHYSLVQWLRHPAITSRARDMAKADPALGLYTSLTAAREAIRAEKRTTALSATIRQRLQTADPKLADLAVSTYDLDAIAKGVAGATDYEALAALIAQDLTPDRIGDVIRVDAEVGRPQVALPATPDDLQPEVARPRRPRGRRRKPDTTPTGGVFPAPQLETAYQTYAHQLDETGQEPTGSDLVSLLGVDHAQSARRIRNGKLRPRYVDEVAAGVRQPQKPLSPDFAEAIAQRTTSITHFDLSEEIS